MNDQPKRRRPRRTGDYEEKELHVRIDQLLFDAVSRPGCSDAYIITRALKIALEKEQPNELKAIALQIRNIKAEQARLNIQLSELRNRAQALGVKDLDKFEGGL